MSAEGEQSTVTLMGGGPWGLRLQGGKDFGAPLTIARVTPAGKADKAALQANDIVMNINGRSTLSLSHMDAQQLVKAAGHILKLEIIRGRDLLAAPLPAAPSSSASSNSSSPVPSSALPPWQQNKAGATDSAATVSSPIPDDLPPPPAYVVDSDTSGPTSAASGTSSPMTSQTSTPSRAPPPWKQTAPAAQDQTSPIPAEVASKARQTEQEGRRSSKDEDVVLGGTFRRLQHQIQNMVEGDEPVGSSLSGGPSPSTSSASSQGAARRTGSQGVASPSPNGARGVSPNQVARSTTPPGRTPPAASPSAKVNLASNLSKLQMSENLQRAQKNAMTDGGAAKDDAAKRMGISAGRVPACGGCGSPIEGPYVQALGKQWHAEHFACSSCATELKGKRFVEHELKPMCEQCYFNHFATRCSACNKAVQGECVSAAGKELHPACFRCERCGTQLGTKGFHHQDGNFYCTDDYEALFSITCTGCDKPVKHNELWVEALGGQWHDTCFVCAVCKVPLQGGKFFSKLGRPYCKTHA